MGAAERVARRVAGNSRHLLWWRNSDGDVKRVLTIAYFDKLGLLAPTLMTSTSRTARCGPSCRVVWKGLGQVSCPPLSRFVADQKGDGDFKSRCSAEITRFM